MNRLIWRIACSAFAALAFLFAADTSAQAAGMVRKAPAPAWAVALAVPQPSPARRDQVSGGIYYLLVDHQVRPGEPADVDYRRMAFQVTDREGLEEAGKIDIDFDPGSDDVTLHHIRLIRNGAILDRIGDVTIRTLQREEDLEQGVFTGRKQLHLELKDIRVGDVVDYAFSRTTHSAVLASQIFTSQSLTWSAPAGLTYYRLLWPHGVPITLKRFAGAPAPQVTHSRDRDIYEWRMADATPVAGESDAPGWAPQWAEVSVSNMTSWGEVVAWALPIYNRPDRLPADWAAAVDRIAQETADPALRITRALRLVQDRVRYVSLSIGAGSFQPRAPAEVVRSGYGDCKDKALLLTLSLRRLGIDASPALTDADAGRGLPDQPPSANAFDHVIVRIKVAGRSHWVDPTRSQEGGVFPNLAPVRTAWALPIAPGQAALEAIPMGAQPSPSQEVVERYEWPRGEASPLTLAVTTIYRGEDADWMRAKLAADSPADTDKNYLKYYAKMYPGLRRGLADAGQSRRKRRNGQRGLFASRRGAQARRTGRQVPDHSLSA